MGTLVTLDLPADSPVLALPWIITFGPPEDVEEEWEAVVCGPYSHEHAMALAESIVADDDLVALVEPLLPHVSIDDIRGEIEAARLAGSLPGPDAGYAADEGLGAAEAVEDRHVELGEPPGADEIRAGFARIAAQLTGRATGGAIGGATGGAIGGAIGGQ